MIDILMDPLAWAVLSQNAACLDTICCSHFNSHDRCEKPFLSRHQEGLSKPLVQSISSTTLKLKTFNFEIVAFGGTDMTGIQFSQNYEEFLLPPILGRWNLEGNWIYWPVKAKSFAPSSRSALLSSTALTPFSITSINSLLWDGIWDFCRIASPTSTLFAHNITSISS